MTDKFHIFDANETGCVEFTSSNGSDVTFDRVNGSVFIAIDNGGEERAQIKFTDEQWQTVKSFINKI